MDWSQIVTLVSSIALPIFTGGLVWATIALWRSTSRYADATEKLAQATELSTKAAKDMAQSTGRSAEVLEKQLNVDSLNSMHDLLHVLRAAEWAKPFKSNLAAIKDCDTRTWRAYARLVGDMLDNVENETPQGGGKE